MKYMDEIERINRFRNSLLHENILRSFATFVYDSKLNIILDVVDRNLSTLLSWKIWPDDADPSVKQLAPLQEATRLAGALRFLHDSQRASFYFHTSLEPGSILVTDLPPEQSRDRESSATHPVGRWLMCDFDIFVISAKREPVSPYGSLPFNKTLARDGVPRLASFCESPEAKGDKDNATRARNMWSFGCILSLVLAFALGGPKSVRELNLARQSIYDDDYFYYDNEIKPEIKSWLQALETKPELRQEQYWIKDILRVLEKLLVLDPKSRWKAGEVARELSRICQQIRLRSRENLEDSILLPVEALGKNPSGLNGPQVPSHKKPSVTTESHSVGIVDRQNATSKREFGPIHSQPRRPAPSRFAQEQPQPPKPPISSRKTFNIVTPSSLPQKPTFHVSKELTPITASQAHSITRLPLPRLGANHASLSPCGKRAAFWNSSLVRVYQLNIDQESNEGRVQTSLCFDFSCSGLATVHLAGKYVALEVRAGREKVWEPS